MSDDSQTIFVVDDDQGLCKETSAYLEQYGFATACYYNTRDLRKALEDKPCDLILLDIMLPGEDGITFFRNLEPPKPKVIIVSALGDETSKVLGLELGVDDYMVKPFSLRELLARIRRSLRRPDLPQDDRPCLRYHFSGWIMEPGTRLLITPDGLFRDLSGVEFRLLQVFLENPTKVLGRDFLTKEIGQHADLTGSRVLDMQIYRLRTRLNETGKEQQLLRTAWGDGYILSAHVTKEYPDE